MLITIQTDEKTPEATVVKPQEPKAIETCCGGAQAVQSWAVAGETVSLSAPGQTERVGIDAGSAPDWLLDAIQHQAASLAVTVGETAASVMDGGSAPSE